MVPQVPCSSQHMEDRTLLVSLVLMTAKQLGIEDRTLLWDSQQLPKLPCSSKCTFNQTIVRVSITNSFCL